MALVRLIPDYSKQIVVSYAYFVPPNLITQKWAVLVSEDRPWFARERLFQRRLGRADVLDHRIAPAVDMHPLAVTHSVLEAGHVDHVATRLGVRHGVVRLLVRDHDQAVVLLVNLTQCLAQVRSAVRLAGVESVTQSEPLPCRYPHQLVGEAVEAHLLGDLTQQHRQTVRRIVAAHLCPARKRRVHRPGDVHQQHGLTRQLGLSLQRLQHRLLQLRLPLRRVSRSRDETERQYTLGLHAIQTCTDHLLIYLGLRHVAQVPQQSQSAQLVLGEQTLPCLALISAGRESDLPRFRRCQFTRDQALPQLRLRRINRLGMAEKQHVPKLDRGRAVVLAQRVLVKLGECSSQPLLYLRRK